MHSIVSSTDWFRLTLLSLSSMALSEARRLALLDTRPAPSGSCVAAGAEDASCRRGLSFSGAVLTMQRGWQPYLQPDSSWW